MHQVRSDGTFFGFNLMNLGHIWWTNLQVSNIHVKGDLD